MRLSHKRKVKNKVEKWYPRKFCSETFIGSILAHDLSKPFPRAIKNELAVGGSSSIYKKLFKNWTPNINEDTSTQALKREAPEITDYLIYQVYILNILCRNYSFRHTKPFMQLYTSSIVDKIKSNTGHDKTFSKGNCEPFKSILLSGYNHSHIELFCYSRLRMFEDFSIGNREINNKTEIFERVKNHLEEDNSITIRDAVEQQFEEKAKSVLNKSVKRTGKITGFWLVSKTVNNKENYICITPHANKTFTDECIRSIINIAENYPT